MQILWCYVSFFWRGKPFTNLLLMKLFSCKNQLEVWYNKMEMCILLQKAKIGNFTGFHKMAIIFNLLHMPFHVINSLDYEENAKKGLHKEFFVKTLFHLLCYWYVSKITHVFASCACVHHLIIINWFISNHLFHNFIARSHILWEKLLNPNIHTTAYPALCI